MCIDGKGFVVAYLIKILRLVLLDINESIGYYLLSGIKLAL